MITSVARMVKDLAKQLCNNETTADSSAMVNDSTPAVKTASRTRHTINSMSTGKTNKAY